MYTYTSNPFRPRLVGAERWALVCKVIPHRSPFALCLSVSLLNFVTMDLEPRRIGDSPSTLYCWAEDPREASMHEDVFSISVNRNMLNYFSQPGGRIDPTSFVAIYCLNPVGDDNCPVGICPNPDIAGVLVRIARTFSVSFLQRWSSNPSEKQTRDFDRS